jgi:hypothetical protein
MPFIDATSFAYVLLALLVLGGLACDQDHARI